MHLIETARETTIILLLSLIIRANILIEISICFCITFENQDSIFTIFVMIFWNNLLYFIYYRLLYHFFSFTTQVHFFDLVKHLQ